MLFLSKSKLTVDSFFSKQFIISKLAQQNAQSQNVPFILSLYKIEVMKYCSQSKLVNGIEFECVYLYIINDAYNNAIELYEHMKF